MSLMTENDIPFILSKVLFELTRNILLTSSSDIFLSFLKLVVRILREKVVDLTIATNYSLRQFQSGI